MTSGGSPINWRRHVPGPRAIVAGAALAVALLLAVATLVPWLDASSAESGLRVRRWFAPICHQIPERSFAGAAGPHALCARCEGLYLGGALALALGAGLPFASRRGANRWWLLALAPTALDLVVRAAGGAGFDSFARFVTAVPAGFVAGYLLAAGLADCSLILSWRTSIPGELPVASRAGRLAEINHG